MINSYRYVLHAEVPKFIPIADKPLNLGGEIKQLPIEEFQKRIGSVYNDGISVDVQSRISSFKENVTGSITADALKKQVKIILKSPFKYLHLRHMGKYGFGVFASRNIPKDTVVAIYGGTIMNGHTVSDRNDHSCGYYGSNMAFSTKYHRGIASFMQHLPEKPTCLDAKTFSQLLKIYGQNVSEEQLKLNVELYSTEFSSEEVRASVVTANVRREYLGFNNNNTPGVALVTDKEILRGKPVGFNYTYVYWTSRNMTPEYFDKSGNALAYNLYKRTFGKLNFEGFSYIGEYKPLIDSINQGHKSVRLLGDDKRLHKVASVKLMGLLLNAHACRIEINPICKVYFDNN